MKISPRRSTLRATFCLGALAVLASCGEDGRTAPDLEEVFVDHGAQSLELSQRFDERGEVLSTVVTHREGSHEREVRVRGALVEADGATEAGVRVRRFLSTLDPTLLARLHGAGIRYDLAVLAADALLTLDEAGQAAAARELDRDGASSLCALLGACQGSDSSAPQT